ncbi:MAG: hypothetical protein JSR64_17440 [Nitrospira sp.]|jgi:PIN domain nuclease of toxin-antitoxin system|nr:hypothetical protein [Nitrospira sp.]MBS0175826.1 hypothetical protein [Nitrospira sp.]MBX3336445.1 hypothetical protein [Nitrospira sp.]MCW5778978.1 hypothetical protein [Nitrospira sp.]
MRDATYVSNETKKLMLSYATELERERKGELAMMELRQALSEHAEKVRAHKAAMLNLTPEMAKQIAPYIKIINNPATRLEDRQSAARRCIDLIDRCTTRKA